MNYGLWDDDENNTLIKSNKNLINYVFEKSGLLNKTNMNILDVGCGYGEQDIEWCKKLDKTCKLTAIDLAEKQIYYASEKNNVINNPQLNFEICDAMFIDKKYKKCSFDTIISLESAFHYPDRLLFFKNVNYLMKDSNSTFIITDLTLKNSYTHDIITELFIQIFSGFFHIPKHNLITSTEWHNQLVSSGLNIIETIDITKTTIEPYYNHFMITYIKNKKLPCFLSDILIKLFCSIQPFSYIIAVCKK
jgi:2-polyprenyl-3-methyl-5-hydroxy-6-metoxy-1,4-benzoquinol methylase